MMSFNSNDLTGKQSSAVYYRQRKLLNEKEGLERRGCVYIVISAILLSIIINSAKVLTIVDFILDCFYVSCMLSGPLCFFFILIVNQYFIEKLNLESFRFCKMTKEKRGWVLH